ncbi:MAG: hypothetical protein K2L72_03590 [Clostridia bacterium]|nr:hypothetical protein [Clostridia bacterium]
MARVKKSNIFAAVGAATGLGNAFRFPALCVSYGAAFIIAYAAVLILVCFPLMCAELYVGKGVGRGRAAKLLSFVMRLAAANSALIALYYGVICSKLGGACLSFAAIGRADGGVLFFIIAAASVIAVVFLLLGGGARALSRSGALSVTLSLLLFPCLAVAGIVRGKIFSSVDFSVLAGGAVWADALGQALLALSLASGVMPALARSRGVRNVPLTAAAITGANFIGCLASACATLPFVTAFPEGGGINVALTVYPQVISAVAPNAAAARFIGFAVYAVLTVVAVHSLCSLALPAVEYASAKVKRAPLIFCLLAAATLPVFALGDCCVLTACDRMACSVTAIIIALDECLAFAVRRNADGKAVKFFIRFACVPACGALALFSLCSARFSGFPPVAVAAAYLALAAVAACGVAPPLIRFLKRRGFKSTELRKQN